MDRLEFVDTHVHFWDLTHPNLHYSWLQPDSVHPQLGEQLDRIKGKNYVAEDFVAETRGANVTKAVHVQAALGIEDPVKESEWLQQAADRTGFPQAIVAYSNLKNPALKTSSPAIVNTPTSGGFATSRKATTWSIRTSTAATLSWRDSTWSQASTSSGRTWARCGT